MASGGEFLPVLPMPNILPDVTTLAAFALATVVLAITPGPDMALQLSRTVNYGRAHGLAVGFGAMSGIAVHTTLVALGVSVLIVAAPIAFLVLKLAGAAYLIWLAYQAVVHGGGLRIAARAARTPTIGQSFLTGVGINLLNPKVVLFFVTFLPQFVDRADPLAPEKLFVLGAEFVLISIPLMVITVLLAAQLTAVLTRSAWVQRVLNYSFAAVFATFAVVILGAQARH